MKKLILLTIIIGSILVSCSNETKKEIITSDNSKTEVKQEENKSAWQIVQVADEFGDTIKGKSVIAASFNGTMSNSVIADAELVVTMQIQDSIIYSFFYEYGRKPEAQLPNSESLTIKIKNANGEIIKVRQFLYKNMMVDTDKELLNILLNQDLPVSVIVDISKADKYSTGLYNYKIDPNGLKEIIK